MNAYRESMLHIFRKYLEMDRANDDSKFFSYDVVEKIQSSDLMFLHAEYLACDLREIINKYHAWTTRLTAWATWNDLLKKISEGDEKSWEIRNEFLQPIVFFCLHQPSSFKDLLIKYCTIAFHFGNMNRFPSYKDQLVEDNEIFKRLLKNHPEPYKYFLTRSQTLKQLREKSLQWSYRSELLDEIGNLDNEAYEVQSKGWRNHAAHYIPPRLTYGVTRTVTRQVNFQENLVTLDNGTAHIVINKDRKQISYGFGGTTPLDSEKIYEANLQQHSHVQKVLLTIHKVLDEIIATSLAKKLDRLNLTSDLAQFSDSAPVGKEFGAKSV
jgi:hypothetical protein